MKTFLAYVITLIISQFCLTAGVVVGTIVFGTFLGGLLVWLPKRLGISLSLPERIGTPLCSFLNGATGSILSITVAFLVFKWLVGYDSFGWGPFLAATIPLAIPIYNDYRKYLEVRLVQSELPERVAAFAAPASSGFGTAVVGELAGIILGGVLFL